MGNEHGAPENFPPGKGRDRKPPEDPGKGAPDKPGKDKPAEKDPGKNQ
jgi:hypothetical protein